MLKKNLKRIFLGHFEPSEEAGSPLLFSKSFFPDFLYEKKIFLDVFWGSFEGEKAIFEKKIYGSDLLRICQAVNHTIQFLILNECLTNIL